MKSLSILLLTCLIFTQNVFSTNYYFSSTTGDDDYSSNQAQDPSTPWKSIDCLNSSMSLFLPGDSILFKRGDEFTGQINFSCSGNSNAKIVFGAFGQGEAPRVTGSIPVSSWIHYSENIWIADCPQLGSTVTNFYINGKSQQIGRYPNADEPNAGYLNVDEHIGQQQLTCYSLPSSPDWSGGEAVIRTQRWILDLVPILFHSGNTLIFMDPTSNEIQNDYGFFIQNHLGTLDKNGEWYYDKDNQKIYLFHSTNPNLLKTEATAFPFVFKATGIQYVTIENIEFNGSYNTNIHIKNSSNLELENNIITYAGNDGVYIEGSTNIDFAYNQIIHTNNNALVFSSCKNVNINNNYIHCTGLNAGMGSISILTYLGMFINGSNFLCKSNIIDSVGYNGILFGENSISIKNNYIDHFCMTLDDGGGIYTSGDENDINYDRIIENNIILNGIGAGSGTDRSNSGCAEGIYMDDRTNNVMITGNTVANCADYGIFIHNANHCTIMNNTVYNNEIQLVFVHDISMPDYPITNCLVQDNIFFSKSESQLVASYRTVDYDFSQFGTFNNNYYCRPTDDDITIQIAYNDHYDYVYELLSLEMWKKMFNHDLNSSTSSFTMAAYSILNLKGSNKISNGSFDDSIEGWSFWSTYNNHDAAWDNSSNQLDNGCLRISVDEPSDNNKWILTVNGFLNDIIKGETYIIRCSMISSQPEKIVTISMHNGSEPYNTISLEKSILVGTNRKEYEILLVADESRSNASIDFIIEQGNETYWIDNVEIYSADIQMTDINDSVLFVYNPSNSAKIVYDNNYYLDIQGNKYHNFSIEPFSSIILFRVSKEKYDNYPNLIPVSSITISSVNGNSTIDTPSGSLQLYAIISPSNSSDKSVNWSVNNLTGQATISSSGLLTALGNGTVTVIATANDESNISGFLDISITNQNLQTYQNEDMSNEVVISVEDYKINIQFEKKTAYLFAYIYNVMGNLVINQKITDTQWSIDTGGLIPGIYILVLRGLNQTKIAKISIP